MTHRRRTASARPARPAAAGRASHSSKLARMTRSDRHGDLLSLLRQYLPFLSREDLKAVKKGRSRLAMQLERDEWGRWKRALGKSARSRRKGKKGRRRHKRKTAGHRALGSVRTRALERMTRKGRVLQPSLEEGEAGGFHLAKIFAYLLPLFSEKLTKTEEQAKQMGKKLEKTEKETEAIKKKLEKAQEILKNIPSVSSSATSFPPLPLSSQAKILPVSPKEAPRLQEKISLAGLGGLKIIEKLPPPPDKKVELINLEEEKTEKGRITSATAKKEESIAIDNASLKDLGGLKSRKSVAPSEAPLVVEKEAGILQNLLSSFSRKAAPPAEEPKVTAPVQGIPESKNAKDTTPKPTLTAVELKEEAERAPRQQIKDEEERRAQEERKKKVQAMVVEQTKVVMVTPPRQKARQSAFQQFIGSLKYLGMGKERLTIIQNLGTMLNAGLPLIDSLHTLQMETKMKPVKKLLQRVIDAVENGSALWRAMEDQYFFSPHAIALIRIGEEAGNLAENIQYLSLQQEKDQELRSKVKQAMIYPIIVLVLMFIIVMGLGLFVLPNLIQVLFSLNVKLPLVTRLVIMFTNAFTTYASAGIPSFLGGMVFLFILTKFTRFKVVVQWIVFHIPGVGRLAKEATLARFGVILGGLLEAGVPLVDALRSLVEVTTLERYKRFYARLLEHINVGDSFAKSFAIIHGSQKVLPVSVQQLIITGERTGSLAKIMLKIAEIYEKKANDTAQKLPVILEPMLLLFIGALVGTIAFAIIVPIYSIVGNVGR